jgi:hypothetical protein
MPSIDGHWRPASNDMCGLDVVMLRDRLLNHICTILDPQAALALLDHSARPSLLHQERKLPTTARHSPRQVQCIVL